MGVRNIAVLITGDARPLRAVLQDAGAQVDRFARQTEQGTTRSATATTAAAAGVGAAIYVVVDALKAIGAATVEFDANLRSVNTIAGLTEAQLRKTGDALLDLSDRVPKTAEDVSSALYDVTSSGFAGAEALTIVEQSAKAATAGLTSTGNAAKAIDAVLNAYGLSAKDAADVSDVLFQTVNVGVLSFEDLTGIIGDTVGAAAAAKIPIDELGAAVATLTLSGISPSESGTSVSRLIEQLIAPSEKLADVYAQLGYESGEAALKSKGLAGVMGDIRTATGGNVTALLGLFPEVRAARGAFALLANDGETYQRALDQVADANGRAGSTQRAFNEQMKSTREQFQLTLNQLQNDSIRAGLKILPVFNDLLKVTRDVGQVVGDDIAAGFALLAPTFDSLASSGQNVLEVVVALYKAAEPVAGVLLDMGGSAVIAGLSGLAAALDVVTGFLADHPDLVLAVAAVYLATLVPSLVAVQVAFNRMILTPIVLFLNSLLIGAGSASAALRGLAASAASVAAIALPIFAATQAFNGFSSAGAGAKQTMEEFARSADVTSLDSALKGINDLQGQMQALQERDAGFNDGPAIKRWGFQVGQALQQMVGGKNDILENAKAIDATATAISEIADKAQNVQRNLKAVGETTGLSVQALEGLARAGKIDLSGTFDDSADARGRLIDDVRKMQQETGLAAGEFDKAFGQQAPEAIQATIDAIAKLQADTAKAFAGAFDVVNKFDPTGGVTDDAIDKAVKRVEKARKRLSDARDRADASKGSSTSERLAIENASKALADAQEAAAKTTAKRAGASLEQFYTDSIAKGRRFTRELASAVERGLDPAVVQRLLTAGPEAALPVLDALANDRKGRLIKIVNAGEQELARLNRIAVEQARLTAIAINSATDQAGRDLQAAMRISQEVIRAGGKATAEALAKSLRMDPKEIQRIANEFGITLVSAVQAAVNSRKVIIRADGSVTTGSGKPLPSGPGQLNMWDGGLIPSTLGVPGRDSVPLLAAPREYVQPVASVDYYGVDFMERVRTRRLPRFWDGGLVGSDYTGAALSGMGRASGAQVVQVPVASTHTVQAPMNVHIDRLVTQDAGTFRTWGKGHHPGGTL